MDWLNYHHLLYFCTVVRVGSIVKASEQLRLAPPTISAQIHQLEASLGQKLLRRSGRNIVPTEMGRLVFRYADRIFSLGGELVEMVRGQATSRPLRFVIGVDDVLPKEIAYQLIEPVLHLNQPVEILCREAGLERLLAELALQELDVVLSDAPVSPTMSIRAHHHLLGECSVSFVAVPRLAQRYKAGFPHSLRDAPMLLMTDDTDIRRSLDGWFSTRHVRPKLVAEFEDYALLRVFGRAGAGIFPAPSVLEQQFQREEGIVRVGRVRDVRGRFYAISLERNLQHPGFVAICEAGRRRLFKMAR